jgi:hypothetical protein
MNFAVSRMTNAEQGEDQMKNLSQLIVVSFLAFMSFPVFAADTLPFAEAVKIVSAKIDIKGQEAVVSAVAEFSNPCTSVGYFFKSSSLKDKTLEYTVYMVKDGTLCYDLYAPVRREFVVDVVDANNNRITQGVTVNGQVAKP